MNRGKTLSIKDYLDEIKPYLSDIINDDETQAEWKIKLKVPGFAFLFPSSIATYQEDVLDECISNILAFDGFFIWIFKKYKSSLYFEVMLKEAMNLLKQILASRSLLKWLKRTKMFCTWIQNLIYTIVSKFELKMSLKASYFGVRMIFQMSLKTRTLDHSLQFHYLYSNRNLDVVNIWLQVNALFYMILYFHVLQINVLETIT